MKNKQKKGFLYKVILFSTAIVFSYSLSNSVVIGNYTGISEFGSIALANQGQGNGNQGQGNKNASKAAEPVSPLVAPKITALLPFFSRAILKALDKNCIA